MRCGPYAYALNEAQEMAQQARTDSWAARRRLVAAQQAQAAANQPVFRPAAGLAATGPAPMGPVFTAGQPDHEEEIRFAKGDLDQAESLLDDATELRDRAAARARNLLDDANHDDLKNPNRGFFSPLGGIADSFKDLGENLVTVGAAGLMAAHTFTSDPIGSVAGVATGHWRASAAWRTSPGTSA